VKSCAFDPDRLPEAERERWTGLLLSGESSVMTCRAAFEQTCVNDPCLIDQEDRCKTRCRSTCQGCGGRCIKTCDRCKRACQDDACRLRCAEGCATCRETCVRQRDRCASGTCTTAYKQCRTRLRAEWLRKGCKAICTSYTSCLEACRGGGGTTDERCQKQCRQARTQGCNLDLCPASAGFDPGAAP
jgi:hypothetical protein